MKRLIIAAAVAAALASGASAQSGANDYNPALKNPSVETTASIATGRNSFTRSQAQQRIAKAGYTNVGKLAKSGNGAWQGKAMKDGKAVMVALDYKGDVTAN